MYAESVTVHPNEIGSLQYRDRKLEQRLVNEAGLWLNAGTMYGTEGKGFMRWNIACPRTTLAEGLKRFTGFVRNL